ncbi:sensor histidine kinase [Adhaeretor mobilis]|uniref:histidine kinase n=1 Tax=Adhaeretor mobilis TaxID=1930276 RepID=A0A517N0J3_9BACT|nr:ATP-binding protein [Adhaeretor mobilis]QDT00659.1 Sensor protein ZraS [Adhaeretor mobilis]
MPSHWPIRTKLKIGLALLLVTVLSLFGSAYYGLYSYRGLVRNIRARSAELPLASQVRQHVGDLRITLSQAKERLELPDGVSTLLDEYSLPRDDGTEGIAEQIKDAIDCPWDAQWLREQYRTQFELLTESIARYRRQLDQNSGLAGSRLGDDRRERETLAKIDSVVAGLSGGELEGELKEDWLLDELQIGKLRSEVDQLATLVVELPSHLHTRFAELVSVVRARYRTAIIIAWVNAALAVGLLGLFFRVFYQSFAKPFGQLVSGSRRVASGEFEHRIQLDTEDEMGELAASMNQMTSRFSEIKDDLDQQVRQRTNQVVRSEQLASVGFLAAGVSHEINNPLASIALCSESLEGRLDDLLKSVDDSHSEDVQVARNYLQMIQREAFRCKQITEKLLDFARMGDSQYHGADLRDLAASVIEMVQHLGKYQDKNLELVEGPPVIAEINAQEIKQVALNLITNALESVDSGGTVRVTVERSGPNAQIVVEDNGCGMSEEVRKHLFEPFFTRRRTGQGTGLGLSITYRIVEEHGGTIEAASDGPDRGSKFVVNLPAHQLSKENGHGRKAA